MKKVIFDFMELKDDPADLIDGSDDLLPEAERVTDADRRDPAYGALRQVQQRRKAEAEAARAASSRAALRRS